jgi:hypothetical protein
MVLEVKDPGATSGDGFLLKSPEVAQGSTW